MGKKIDVADIIGSRSGKLTVESYAFKRKGNHFYNCRCDCGNTSVVRRDRIIHRETRSCGCTDAAHTDVTDILGKRYGKLVVTEYAGFIVPPSGGKRQSAYRCHCDCGNDVIILRHDLKADLRRSCGKCSYIETENGYCRYYCANGESWIFDAEDYDFVASRAWHIDSTGYPVTHLKMGENHLPFHRLIMNAKPGDVIDHINGCRWDGRKQNLRKASPRKNQYNKCVSSTNKCGYKGVIRESRGSAKESYRMSIRANGMRIQKSGFATAEEAARAYDEAARFYFGEFACVNFPRPGEQGCRRNQPAEKQEERMAG